jgi:hypothetical protein
VSAAGLVLISHEFQKPDYFGTGDILATCKPENAETTPPGFRYGHRSPAQPIKQG